MTIEAREAAKVPIQTWLPGEVYRPLAKFADEHGCTVGQVVEQITRQSVLGSKASMMLSPKKREIAERREKVRALVEKRKTQQEIAAILDVGVSTVFSDIAHMRRAEANA